MKHSKTLRVVKAVLMSHDYKKANCGNVGRLARIIYDNHNWLRQNGHSKWNEVNLDQRLAKWEQYSCDTAALRGDGGGGTGGGSTLPRGAHKFSGPWASVSKSLASIRK